MSLPWIPLYLDAYTGDTMHLTCEEHGAYLQLMLAYYRSEKPLPASDRSLAAIVKLEVNRWLECKPTLAEFFREEGGFWHHDRIEAEIADRAAKHAKSVTKAKAGAAAMLDKRDARSRLQQAPSRPEAKPTASPSPADLHLHINSLSTEADRDAIEEEVPIDPSAQLEPTLVESIGMGSPIDPAFELNENQLSTCKFDGATPEIIASERQGFVNYHLEKGSLSNDWDATWARWWQRWKEFVAKQAEKSERTAKRDREKAPPRIEVNTTIDWDNHCKFWRMAGKWPRGIGPDPDSVACKCPPEILAKHGIKVTA